MIRKLILCKSEERAFRRFIAKYASEINFIEISLDESKITFVTKKGEGYDFKLESMTNSVSSG